MAPQLIDGDPLAAVPTPVLRSVLFFCQADAEAAYISATGARAQQRALFLSAAGAKPKTVDTETWEDLLVAYHASRTLSGDSGYTDRSQALRALVSTGSEARVARAGVIQLLENTEARTAQRVQAVQVLRELDDGTSRAALRRAFRTSSNPADLRIAALDALESVGHTPKPIGQALSALIQDRVAASEAGRRMATLLPRDEAIDRLLRAMRSESIDSRQGAYTGFAVLGTRAGRASPELAEQASAEVASPQRNTARALWSLAAVSEIPPEQIGEFIGRASPEGRKQIAAVLSRDDDLARASLAWIATDLLRTDRPFSDPLRRVLEAQGAQASRELRASASDSNVAESRRLLMMSRLDPVGMWEVLGALEDPDRAVRRLAIDTIPWRKHSQSFDAIVSAIEREQDDELKYALIRQVVADSMPSRRAARAIAGLTGTPAEPRLGYAALKAMAAVSPDPALTIDQSLLALADPHPPTRYLACHTLQSLPEAGRAAPRTRPALLGLIESLDEPVRRSAVETLKSLWPDEFARTGDQQ